MNNEQHMILILALQQLLDSMRLNGENNNRSKLLSEKIAQVLESIPEFVEFLDEDNKTIRHKFCV